MTGAVDGEAVPEARRGGGLATRADRPPKRGSDTPEGKQSLTQRAVVASVWNFVLRGTIRGAGFIRNVVLARILAPEDFGLFGIALVILSIVSRFSKTGFQSALIQKDRDITEYLDNYWTVQAARNLAAVSVIFFGAPFFANFFGEPGATPMIQALALYVGLGILTNPAPAILFPKELEFHRQFFWRSGGLIVELVVSIVAGVLLRSAWALMLGLIAGRVAMVVISYLVHPYRPRIGWKWKQTRELSVYGRWVFFGNMLNFLSYRGDNLIIGKLLGAPALGVYMLAYSMSEVLTGEISRVLTDIAFPAYAKVQGDLARLRSAFSSVLDIVISVSLPTAVVMWFLAEPIVRIVLGERWLEAATVLPYLALAGAIRVLIGNSSSVFKAIGKPSVPFTLNVTLVVVMYLVIFPLVHFWGMVGVAVAVLTGVLATFPLLIANLWRYLGFRTRDLWIALAPSMLLGLGAVATLGSLRSIYPAETNLGFAIHLLAFSVVYAATAVALWHFSRSGPLKAIELARAKKGKRGKSRSNGSVPSAPSEAWEG